MTEHDLIQDIARAARALGLTVADFDEDKPPSPASLLEDCFNAGVCVWWDYSSQRIFLS